MNRFFAGFSFLFLSVFLLVDLQNGKAQTKYISTEKTLKNVLLEDFTGNNCTFCPLGHKEADSLTHLFPERVFAVNIHAGSLAGTRPDMKTSYGETLSNTFGVSVNPSAAINRTRFPGQSVVALQRTDNQWAKYTGDQLDDTAIMNISARALLNKEERTLECVVECYFTQDDDVSEAKLQIALIQNHIIGAQAGSDKYPEMRLENGMYIHNHVLRDYLYPEIWGKVLQNVRKGAYYRDTVRYKLPDSIKDVPLVLDSIDLIAFVSRNERTVHNVTKASIYTSWPEEVANENLSSARNMKISILPNPLNESGTVRVEVLENVSARLEIYSSDGRRVRNLGVFRFSPENSSAVFDASGLPAGFYILRLTYGTGTQSCKFSVLR